MKKNILKNSKGITLVSLIVTIIVLVILASIGLSSLTGETSIIKHAQNAKNSTEVSEKNEETKIENILAYANNLGINSGAHIHKYTVISETPATCAEPGKKVYECNICAVTKEIEIEKTSEHNYETDPTTGVSICSICGTNVKFLCDIVDIGDYVNIEISYENQETFYKSYVSNTYAEKGMTGWRVLNKSGSGTTGTVTLVTAGVPLMFYYSGEMDVSTAITTYSGILNSEITIVNGTIGFSKNGFDDNNKINFEEVWSRNSNINASTAHVMTLDEIITAYEALTGEKKTITDLSGSEALKTSNITFKDTILEEKAKDLLGIGMSYWLGYSNSNDNSLKIVNFLGRIGNSSSGLSRGVRLVVSLNSGVQIAVDNTGTGANENNAYKLAN